MYVNADGQEGAFVVTRAYSYNPLQNLNNNDIIVRLTEDDFVSE